MSPSGDVPEHQGSRLLSIGARVAAAVMVVGVLGIFAFILRSGLAHDESRCPFEEGEHREVAEGVVVLEERRACQEGVEERRWTILRAGEAPREFARRRLGARSFRDGAYEWSVRTDPDGALILQVHNEAAPDIEVLEAKLLEQ